MAVVAAQFVVRVDRVAEVNVRARDQVLTGQCPAVLVLR